MSAEQPGTGRIEAFSDGVIAIIITIMVLELKLPEHAADQGLWAGLVKPLAPKLISYALSFLVVAIMWVNHHALMDSAPRATKSLMWWNNHLLFWMSLIPLVTAFVGENPILPIAVALYGFVLFAGAASFTLLRLCVVAQAPTHATLRALHRRALTKSIVGNVLYGLSVPLAFLSVYLSMAIFVLVPAMFFLPDWLPDRVVKPNDSEQAGL